MPFGALVARVCKVEQYYHPSSVSQPSRRSLFFCHSLASDLRAEFGILLLEFAGYIPQHSVVLFDTSRVIRLVRPWIICKQLEDTGYRVQGCRLVGSLRSQQPMTRSAAWLFRDTVGLCIGQSASRLSFKVWWTTLRYWTIRVQGIYRGFELDVVLDLDSAQRYWTQFGPSSFRGLCR